MNANVIQRNGEKIMKEGNQSTMAVLANDNKIYEANEMNNVILLNFFINFLKLKKEERRKGFGVHRNTFRFH